MQNNMTMKLSVIYLEWTREIQSRLKRQSPLDSSQVCEYKVRKKLISIASFIINSEFFLYMSANILFFFIISAYSMWIGNIRFGNGESYSQIMYVNFGDQIIMLYHLRSKEVN